MYTKLDSETNATFLLNASTVNTTLNYTRLSNIRYWYVYLSFESIKTIIIIYYISQFEEKSKIVLKKI